MSPRILPSIATVHLPQIEGPLPPDIEASEKQERDDVSRVRSTSGGIDCYALQHSPTRRWNSKREEYEDARPPGPGTVIPSYWRDLLLEAESEQRATRSLEHWPPTGDRGDPNDPSADAHLAAARERLSTTRQFARLERRDITGGGTSFLPAAGPPGYIASAFATAARSKSPLADALIRKPHPGSLKVSTPRIVNGAAVSVQTAENAAAQETDPTSALAEVPTATIAGQLDLSRQLYDFSDPGADEWVAAELGADYAEQLENQLVNGLGNTGQTLGLRSVSGATSVTKTNGSPTFQTNLAAIGDLVSQTATAYGAQSSDLLLVMSPRRFDWIVSKATFAVRFPLPEANIVLSPAIPLNLGAGTNQDVVLCFPRSEVFLYEKPVQFKVYPDVGSSTLTVRISALGYAALLSNRQPAAVGILSGSELATPVF